MSIQAPNIRVLGARLVVVEDEKQQAINGIIIPDKMQDKPLSGTVVAVGPGAYTFDGERIPMDVSVGDKVVWTNIAGVPVKINDVTYLVINESHIIAVIGKEEVIPHVAN